MFNELFNAFSFFELTLIGLLLVLFVWQFIF